MARTTTDPKSNTVAMRLNDADLALLDGLVKRWGCSRTDVLRRFLRSELKIGQRVIVHVRPPLGDARDVQGVITGLGRVRKGRPQRYEVQSPACSPGQIELWNVPQGMLSVAEDTLAPGQPCRVKIAARSDVVR